MKINILQVGIAVLLGSILTISAVYFFSTQVTNKYSLRTKDSNINNSFSQTPSIALNQNDTVCTMDAKICPDGTSVGRTGPNCEFAECPSDNKKINESLISWKKETINDCSLSLTVPVFSESLETFTTPEDRNRTWRVDTRKLDSGYEPFTVATSISYERTDGLGSGYVASNVYIECAPNTKRHTTDLLFNEVKNVIQSSSNEYFTLDIKKIQDSVISTYPAIKYSVTGREENNNIHRYLLATNTHVYKIHHISMSDSQFLQTTTEQIFNSLEIK